MKCPCAPKGDVELLYFNFGESGEDNCQWINQEFSLQQFISQRLKGTRLCIFESLSRSFTILLDWLGFLLKTSFVGYNCIVLLVGGFGDLPRSFSTAPGLCTPSTIALVYDACLQFRAIIYLQWRGHAAHLNEERCVIFTWFFFL